MSNWTKVDASKVVFRAVKLIGEGVIEGLYVRFKYNDGSDAHTIINNGHELCEIKPETLEMRVEE
jgi:hypothetical protein